MSISPSTPPSGSNSPFATPPETPSGRVTPYSPKSILKDLAFEEKIKNTWSHVEGQEPSVNFIGRTLTVLVPTRKEREDNGIIADTRWSDNDIERFKKSARIEVLTYMAVFKVDSHTAKRELYRP